MPKSCFVGDKIGHAKSVSLNSLSRLFDKVGVDQCPGECGRANRLSGETTTFQFEISQDHMVFQEETNTIIVIVFLACPGV